MYINNNKLQKIIFNICDNEYKYFFTKSNVVGVGCGYKVRNGFRTSRLCIQVFVEKKISKSLLSRNQLIPNFYKGIITDIIETGKITGCSLTSKRRPVQGGYAISAINYMNYGTAGCLVSNGVSNFLLSTNHTLTGEGEFIMGTPITQPAYTFGGRHPTDTVATVSKSIPLRPIEGTIEPTNLTDCGLGLLTKRNIFAPEIALIGKLKGVKRAHLNNEVKKVGCSSELTTGNVISLRATLITRISTDKRYLFKDLVVTTPMLTLGDSGSILVNNYNYGLALGFAGTSTLSIYCNLDTVLDQLSVHLVT